MLTSIWEGDMGIKTRINGTAPPEVSLADIDLSNPKFWALDEDFRDAAFAALRREAPISFWSETVEPGYQEGIEHWALTMFDDVGYVSRHPEIFRSQPSVFISARPWETE